MVVVISQKTLVEIGILIFLILLAWAALAWSRRCTTKDFDITQGLPLHVKEIGQISELMAHIHDCSFDISQVVFDEEAKTVRLRIEDHLCKPHQGPTRAVLLTIGFVESLTIEDNVKMDLYSVNEVEYYPGEERLVITTGAACLFEMKVTQLDLMLEPSPPTEPLK